MNPLITSSEIQQQRNSNLSFNMEVIPHYLAIHTVCSEHRNLLSYSMGLFGTQMDFHLGVCSPVKHKTTL